LELTKLRQQQKFQLRRQFEERTPMNGNTAYRAKRDVSICHRRKGQNLQAGHVGYVPMSVSHFIENVGDTPSKSLNCFARYMDVSLA
jgi:hypothetical protein